MGLKAIKNADTESEEYQAFIDSLTFEEMADLSMALSDGIYDDDHRERMKSVYEKYEESGC